MSLNFEDLHVESFATVESDPIGYCCTGCVSGCGINPTAGGCDSQPNSYEYSCGCPDTVVAAE